MPIDNRDGDGGGTWDRLLSEAQAEVRKALASLPAELRGRADGVPVCCEPVPSAEMVDDGVEPDLLGLFVGGTYAEQASGFGEIPPQILLFLNNIWDEAEGERRAFRREVRITYLHELGHFLGLDDGELADRGME